MTKHTRSNSPETSSTISIPQLHAVLNGRVITPEDTSYEKARTSEAYPGSTFERLAEIKARYDPTNLFRLNQNIPPRPTA
jgi:FAD/FMN-containing dehydrogenase